MYLFNKFHLLRTGGHVDVPGRGVPLRSRPLQTELCLLCQGRRVSVWFAESASLRTVRAAAVLQ